MMQDMLVKLYELPDYTDLMKKMEVEGIDIRRPLTAEKSIIQDWVKKHFGDGWESETEVSFSYQPVACFVAIESGKVIGFSVYDSAYRNFFGPTGVDESWRGKGIGKVLLFKALEAIKSLGYAYAIIGVVLALQNFMKKRLGLNSLKVLIPEFTRGS